MLAPAAMMIESAAAGIATLHQHLRDSQRAELTAFGDQQARDVLGASGLSEDLIKGYELGLQTARTVLAGSPLLQMKDINPHDLL